MPFCTQCGTQVSDTDAFCASCGSSQPAGWQNRSQSHAGGSGSAAGVKSFTDSISDRGWATLCYLPGFGWLASIYVLAAQRFHSDRTSRFHAFQGLYLFVAWLILDYGVGPFVWHGGGWSFRFSLHGLLQLLLFVAGIFMMVKTHNKEDFRLPIVGELADRSLADQS